MSGTLLLKESELRDRLFGAVLGASLGDAVALPAVGGDPAALREKGLGLPYRTAARGFPLNDVSDRTDHEILAMRVLTSQRRGASLSPAIDLAVKLSRWLESGFPELGDAEGLGRAAHVRRVVALEGFTRDPIAVSAKVGLVSLKGISSASDNSALVRAIPCAFMPEPESWAALMTRVTHADPRAAAAGVAVALLIRAMAEWRQGASFPIAAIKRALEAAVAVLPDAAARSEFLDWARASKEPGALPLREKGSSDYVYVTFACVFSAVRRLHAAVGEGKSRDTALFEELIVDVATEGGEADVNAAVVAAAVGAAVGFSRLPKKWLNALAFRTFIERETEHFLSSL